MASKKATGAQKRGTKRGAKGGARTRQERRFMPQSSHSPLVVRVSGGLGAGLLGAGAYGFFFGEGLFDGGDAWSKLPQWLVAGGSLLLGASIWLGTSSEPAVRVGSAGVAVERGDLHRVPWHGVESVRWDDDRLALVVKGTREGGGELEVRFPAKTQPHAAAWALSEARARIPSRVDVPESVVERLGEPSADVGTKLLLDALQVVGQRCHASQKLVAFDADARVCPRCELVYHKNFVPETCACGADLADAFKKSRPADADEAEGAA